MKTLKSPSEELVFNPEGHKYFIGKKRIPSVSEILAKVGLTKNYEGVDPFYRDRGIATHKAIELQLKGILDIASIDKAIMPHYSAWGTYWMKHQYEKQLALEKPMCSLPQTFAGTPDLVTEKAIYDWKCSKSHDKVADLQGQAYKHLVLDNWLDLENSTIDFMRLPFIVVELHDDGGYTEFNYGPDYEEWSSVMDLWRWKTK